MDLHPAPWDIYARALSKQWGYPLWHPSPEADTSIPSGYREVEVGSVGWVDQGRFRHLFNARRTQDDLLNIGRVPDSFERFDPRNMTETPPEAVIVRPYVASRSVKIDVSRDESGGLSFSLPFYLSYLADYMPLE